MSSYSSIRYLSLVAVACAGLSLSAASQADKLNFNPGMWESTTTMKSTMFGTRTETTKECMSPDKFDPEKFSQEMLKGMPQAQCDSEQDVADNTVTIDMTCNMAGGSMQAAGSWTFSGDEGSGDMKMKVEMQGMQMSMEMETQGRRVGDC